jgi:hypothetical protein
MKIIPLTNGGGAVVDAADYEWQHDNTSENLQKRLNQPNHRQKDKPWMKTDHAG